MTKDGPLQLMPNCVSFACSLVTSVRDVKVTVSFLAKTLPAVVQETCSGPTKSSHVDSSVTSSNGSDPVFNIFQSEKSLKVVQVKSNSSNRKCSAFQTTRVVVEGPKGCVEATVVFYSASDRSCVTQGIIDTTSGTWLQSTDVTYAPFGKGKVSRFGRIYEMYMLLLPGLKVKGCR